MRERLAVAGAITLLLLIFLGPLVIGVTLSLTGNGEFTRLRESCERRHGLIVENVHGQPIQCVVAP